MKELYPLFGIVTVVNTPFTPGDQIDYKSLRKHIRYALDAGVSGFLLPALASEVYQLSFRERLELVSVVMQEVDNKVPVIAGSGETSLVKSRHLLKAYLDLGCRNVLFQIPFENEDQYYRHFMDLAGLGPAMIMLQDWDPVGYGLPDRLIMRLFNEVEAFRCLKIETVPAGIKYSRILALTGNHLNISGGWAVTQMVEGMQRGVHAFMPTGMPYIYTTIYNEFKSGRQKNAIKLFHQLLPVLAFSNQHLDISILFFKRLDHQQELYATLKCRQLSVVFDNIHESIADKLIEWVIETEERIRKERG